MTASRPGIETILVEAVEISSPDKRREYLELVCPDPVLLEQVQRLIANHFEAGSFLEEPAIQSMDLFPDSPPQAVGTQIGPYTLRELIGEGGMGAVYVADQEAPVKRRVALKLIKPGMDSRQVIARFEAERHVLALMDHPHIARIVDSGTTEAGHPFFVMELVRGIPITNYCDLARLSPQARLELFLQVCSAVQHAHQKGIIHRDLNPNNILITLYDGKPVSKVIDFGIAKAVGQQLTGYTVYTGLNQVLGTPLYMSPEQTDLSALDVDTRADVYALGVILYELLTGTTPFDREILWRAGYDEMRRMIRETEPQRPSLRVSTLGVEDRSKSAEVRGIDARRYGDHLRGDLDWIVMRCLEKDRNRRYESPLALASDLQRYLTDQPVEACPPSLAYRLHKFVRRNRAAVGVGLGFLAAFLLGLGGLVTSVVLTRQAYDSETYHRKAAQEAASEAVQARQDALEREASLRLELYASDLRRAWEAWETEDLPQLRALLDRHLPRQGEADQRGFEWHYLNSSARLREVVFAGHKHPILSADLSRDQRHVVTSDSRGTVKFWDAISGRELRTFQGSEIEVTCVRFSPNGRLLAMGGQGHKIRIWNVKDWSEMRCIEAHDGTVTSLDWSPDGLKLVSGGRDRTVKVWDVFRGTLLHSLVGHKDVVRGVAWSPLGKWLVSVGAAPDVRVWNAQTGVASGKMDGETIEDGLSLAFDKTGSQLVTGGYGRPAFVYDMARKARAYQVDTMRTGAGWSVAISPGRRHLVHGGDNWAELWDIAQEPHRRLRTISGRGRFRRLAFSHNGTRLLIAVEKERAVRLVEVDSLLGFGYRKFMGHLFNPDSTGQLALCKEIDTSMSIRRLTDGSLVAKLPDLSPHIWQGVWSPTKHRLVTTSDSDIQVQVWDTLTGNQTRILTGHPVSAPYLAISPDGLLVAAGNNAGTATVWRVETGERVARFHFPDGHSTPVQFSPDGAFLAVVNRPNVELWRVRDWTREAVLTANQVIDSLAFSPDSRILATCGRVHGVILWDMESRQRLAHLRNQFSTHREATFSPDGRTLATIGNDRLVHLWHVPTHRELFTIYRHQTPIKWIRFESPHRLLISIQTPPGENEFYTFPPHPAELPE